MPRAWSADFRSGVEAPASDEPVLVLLDIAAGGQTIRVASDYGTVAGLPIEYQYFGRRYVGFPFSIEVLTDEDRPPRGILSIANVDRRIGPAIQALTTTPSLDITILALNDFDLTVNPRLPTSAPGTVAPIGSASVGVSNGIVDSITFAHEVASGENRALIVGVSLSQGPGSRTVDTVTYGGVSLTRLVGIEQDRAHAELWYLLNPPGGIADVVVTLDGSNDRMVAGAQTYGGVNLGAAFGTAVGDGHDQDSSVASLSIDVASAIGDVVVDVLARRHIDNPPSPDSGQTARWNQHAIGTTSSGTVWGAASQRIATGATTTMGWSWSGDDADTRAAALVGVALKAAPVPDAEIVYRATGLALRNIRCDAMELSADITSFDDLTEPWPGIRATQGRLPGLFR